MNYLVSPGWVYWVSRLDTIIAVLICILITGSVITIVCGLLWKVDEIESLKKVTILSFIITIFIAVLLIFIPSAKTIVEMKIASIVTMENVELTFDELKMMFDYIINAIKMIK